MKPHTSTSLPTKRGKKSLELRILVIRLGKARQVGVFETRKLCWDPLTDCAPKMGCLPHNCVSLLLLLPCLNCLLSPFLCRMSVSVSLIPMQQKKKKDLRIGSPQIHPANKNIHHLLLWGLPLILFGGVSNGGGKTDNDPFLVGRTQIYPHFIPKKLKK